MVGMSRTMSTPGVPTGTMIIDEPWYGETSGSVTHMTMRKSATDAFELNHLWPLITYSSPSSTARVANRVGSAPAPGSVIEKQLRSSPRRSGCIHRSCCSSEPPIASSSALPESGALLPKIPGAKRHRPRISCISPSLTWPNPPPPSSGGRCAAHKPCSLICSFIGAVMRSNVGWSMSRVSSGMISSRTKPRIHSSCASKSGSVAKSHAIRPFPRDGPVVDVPVRRRERHRGAGDLYRVAEHRGVEVALRVGGAEVDAAVGDVAPALRPVRGRVGVDELAVVGDPYSPVHLHVAVAEVRVAHEDARRLVHHDVRAAACDAPGVGVGAVARGQVHRDLAVADDLDAVAAGVGLDDLGP